MPDITPNYGPIDGSIAANRVRSTTRDVEQRLVPRMSIAEMNQADLEDLRQRVIDSPHDDRGPIEKFLDLLDLPRNQILSHLAPGLEQASREHGNTAALGTGRVNASDVLGALGMQPGIVRGTLGFVGDVAFDPLTYAFGAGGVARVLAKGGGEVALRKGATSAIREGAAQFVESGRAADDAVHGLIASAGHTPESVAAELAAGKTAKDAASTITESVLGGGRPGLIERAGSRFGVKPSTFEGGLLGEHALTPLDEGATDAVKAQHKAVQDFVLKYGKGTEPGVKIGADGISWSSGGIEAGQAATNPTFGLLHVPFTGYQLSVPLPIASANIARRNLMIASDAKNGWNEWTKIHPDNLSLSRDVNDAVERAANMPAEMQASSEAEQQTGFARSMAEFNRTRKTPEELAAENELRSVSAAHASAKIAHDEVMGTPLVGSVARPLGEESVVRGAQQLTTDHPIYSKVLSGEYKPPPPRSLSASMEKLVGDTPKGMRWIEGEPELGARLADDGTLEVGSRFSVAPKAARAKMVEMEYAKPFAAKAMTGASRAENIRNVQNALSSGPGVFPYADAESLVTSVQSDVHSAMNAPEVEARARSVDELGQRERQLAVAQNSHAAVSEAQQGLRDAEFHAADARYNEAVAARIEKSHTIANDIAVQAQRVRDGARAIDVTKTAADPGSMQAVLAYGTKMRQAMSAAKMAAGRAGEVESDLKLVRAGDVFNPDSVKRAQDRLFALGLDPSNDGLVHAYADAHSKVSDAASELSASLRAQLMHWDSHDGSDAVLREVAKLALGTGEDAIPHSLFGSLRGAAVRLGMKPGGVIPEVLESLNRFTQTKFGYRASGSAVMDGKQVKMLGRGDPELQAEVAGGAVRELRDALVAEGFDPEKHLDSAASIAYGKMYGAADPERQRYFYTNWEAAKANNGELSMEQVRLDPSQGTALVRHLRDAEASGAFTPGLMARLDEIAGRYKKLADEIGAREVESGVLGDPLKGYVPAVTKAESLSAIGRVKVAEGAERAQGPYSEGFAKHRSTYEYRYHDPETGKYKRFFEMDRALAGMDDAKLDFIATDAAGNVDRKLASELRDMRDTVNRYDSDELWKGAPKPEPKLSDAFSVNELRGQGRFALLMGGHNDDLFETSLPLVMARRIGAHARSEARAMFREIVSDHYFPVPEDSLNKVVNRPGVEMHLRNGLVGTSMAVKTSEGTVVPALKIGDTVYRRLEPALQKDELIKDLFGVSLKDGVVDSRVADWMENITRTWRDKRGEFADALNTTTGAFKAVTLSNPVWPLKHNTGSILNMLAGVEGASVRPGDFAKYMRPALLARYHWTRPDLIEKVGVTVGGSALNGREWLDEARRFRLFSDPARETIRQMADGSTFMRSQSLTGMRSAGEAAKANPILNPSLIPAEFRNAVDDWRAGARQIALANGAGEAGMVQSLHALGNVVSDRGGRWVFAPFRTAVSFMNDVFRMVSYASLRDQGYSAEKAAEGAIKMLYDYEDFTKFEDHTLRPLVPFYAWLKNNMVNQVHLLLNRPSYAAAFPKLRRAVEDAVVGDDAVPMNMRPQWMREAMALQVSRDPDTRRAVDILNLLPADHAYRLGAALTGAQGVQDLAKYLGSAINPAIQVPAAVAFGKELFTGRTIGPTGDETIPQFILRQVRPISETVPIGDQPAPIPQALSGGPGALAQRVFLGGAAQDFSHDRLMASLRRQYMDEEVGLRKKIARAQRSGNTAGSTETRARLLALYSDMLKHGLEADVPKWAQNQLAAMASGG